MWHPDNRRLFKALEVGRATRKLTSKVPTSSNGREGGERAGIGMVSESFAVNKLEQHTIRRGALVTMMESTVTHSPGRGPAAPSAGPAGLELAGAGCAGGRTVMLSGPILAVR